ncbi:hypothetical protein A3H75_02120 [Candidatus Uhrbacteria bacterium RIFCSPLOWO2_02_FULL_51_9]|uniref:Uncharacterized protein n=1 Tax=Candidatus Uhrbacteria bacterium RIFCSPLOWO2_02_FULL_51_9 TaxID=1802410 RepID=A0A1F7VEH2_9BACT|nr:MAG: hypothetical protein A3H75_02120 [Candidatus Uhrbacteria bacterium RIFCSPLOWO2_02_FULL_51_9]
MNEGEMRERYGELVREFSASLGVYVRDDGEGGLLDERDDRAREMAVYSAEELADMVAAQDLAAMISHGISRMHESLVNRIMFLKGGRLIGALQQMRRSGTLPLQAKAGHAVAGILDGLVVSKGGCVLYRDMAVMLLDASREESRSILSYKVVSAVSAQERALPHSDEEVESVGSVKHGDSATGGDYVESDE